MSFEQDCTPTSYEVRNHKEIAIQQRGGGTWTVYRNGQVLNKKGQWEFEPLPTTRSYDFIKRTRWESATASYDFFITTLQTVLKPILLK